jgi:GNAT superfamily N-acetyltransferase
VTVGGCCCKLLAITLDGVVGGVAAMRERHDLVLLALRDGLRGWGYGSEAVAAIEGKARRPIRVLASADVGLSLYFWLRLGYAPAARQSYGPKALLLEKIGRRDGR